MADTGTQGLCDFLLDELPDFDARSLEVLRQPMEDKQVTISRVSGTLTFPANFMMEAAMRKGELPTRSVRGPAAHHARKLSHTIADLAGSDATKAAGASGRCAAVPAETAGNVTSFQAELSRRSNKRRRGRSTHRPLSIEGFARSDFNSPTQMRVYCHYRG